jgi:hypothetical protein
VDGSTYYDALGPKYFIEYTHRPLTGKQVALVFNVSAQVHQMSTFENAIATLLSGRCGQGHRSHLKGPAVQGAHLLRVALFDPRDCRNLAPFHATRAQAHYSEQNGVWVTTSTSPVHQFPEK